MFWFLPLSHWSQRMKGNIYSLSLWGHLKILFLTSRDFRKTLKDRWCLAKKFCYERSEQRRIYVAEYRRWGSRGLEESGASWGKEMERDEGPWVLRRDGSPVGTESSSGTAFNLLQPGSMPYGPSSVPERMPFSPAFLSLTPPQEDTHLTANIPHTSRHYFVLNPLNLPTLQETLKATGAGFPEHLVMKKVHTYPRK